MFERFKRRNETENHQIVIPNGMEFDNELLAKSITSDGRDVRMEWISSCKQMYRNCEINCLMYMFCPAARMAEAMMDDYRRKKKGVQL